MTTLLFTVVYFLKTATSYVPPSQDVICTNSQTSIFKIETREMIMAKINEIRSKISAGTYQLENLDFAVPAASTMNNLVWSCDDEAALFAAPNYLSCDDDSWYDHATEFQKFFQPTATWLTENDFKGYIQELIDEFFFFEFVVTNLYSLNETLKNVV